MGGSSEEANLEWKQTVVRNEEILLEKTKCGRIPSNRSVRVIYYSG
jgi:hypothetical protein